MRIPTDTKVRGVDLSNYDGPISAANAQEIADAGYMFAIVRLSLESVAETALAVQQCEALQAAGLAVFGYVWVYWWQDPVQLAAGAYRVAKQAGVRMVACDIEDAPIPGIDPVGYVRDLVSALLRSGILPLAYTYTYWPSNNHVDFSSLGEVRWWIANKGAELTADQLALYPGARVVGQQFGDWKDSWGQAFDDNWFIFDDAMAAAVNNDGGSVMDEAKVREIVRDELNAWAGRAGQGEDADALLSAILARINAAGRMLTLSEPVPSSAPLG